MTSTSRSSCFSTWSTSAWPASTASVIRDRLRSLVGPTDRPWMLKPRLRTMPLMRESTPGLFSTTAVRTRRLWSRLPLALGVLIGQLLEIVQALAEWHDRVDVGVGVDAEVDQHRSWRPLGEVEGRLDL